MNIDNERKDILEFRAYEMKKLLRILNNKVRSQKFTNQFIAYNAGMNERELFSHMKYKPIKHDSYVRFFNSIVELISNHRGISKEELEENILKAIEKDPLTSVNRISQIIEWNKIKEDHKEMVLPIKEELIDKKEEIATPEIVEEVKEPVKSKEEMVNDIIIELVDLVDIDHNDPSVVYSMNKALSEALKKFTEPVLSFIRCLTIRDVIMSLKTTEVRQKGVVNYLRIVDEQLGIKSSQYFYPYSLIRIIMDKSQLDKIISIYIDFMESKFNFDKEKSMQLLTDQENKRMNEYKKFAKDRFLKLLISAGRHNYVRIPQKKNINHEDILNLLGLDSVTPLSMTKFSEIMSNVIKPYHVRKLGYHYNTEGNACTINAWAAIKAIHNISTKLNINYNNIYGINDEKVLSNLNDEIKKTVRRDINTKSIWSLYARIEKLALYMQDAYGFDIDASFGIIVKETEKAVELFNENISQRLNPDQVKYFDKVINYLFKYEPIETKGKSRRQSTILSRLLKDYMSLVYNAIITRVANVTTDAKKYSVRGVSLHPIAHVNKGGALKYESYLNIIDDGLAPQIADMVDDRRISNKSESIANELKAFIVYQISHFPDEYGVKPIDLKEDEKIKEAKEPVICVKSYTPYDIPEESPIPKVDAKFGACNFNSIEEAEDYIESLFDSNRRVDDTPEEVIEDEHIEETQEITKAEEESIEETQNESDNTDINKESEENMRKEFMEDYDERERDLFGDGIRVGSRRREDIDEDERERSRRRGGRGKSVGFRDLYIAIQVIEEYMKDPTISPDDKEDVVDLIGSFVRRR